MTAAGDTTLVITGATGYLGGALLRAAVAAGARVTAVTRRPAPALDAAAAVVVCDVTALEPALLPRDADAVIHFAQESTGPPAALLRSAAEGTVRAFRAAAGSGARRFIHISSLSVYPGPVPAAALRPGADPRLALERGVEQRGTYAHAKVVAERALMQAVDEQRAAGGHCPQVVIVRPGLVFGDGMAGALAGTAIVLPLRLAAGLGRPAQGAPFVTIDDVNRALLALAERPAQPGTVRVYDLLSGAPPAKAALLDAYRRLSGQSLRMVWLPEPLVRAAAPLAERLLARLDRGRGLAYQLRRAYAFELRALPHQRLWDDLGIAPTGTLDGGLRAALTPPRAPRPFPPDATRLHPALAADHLAAAATPLHTRGEPVPLVIVGAGAIVEELHLPALAALPGYRVIAAVDPRPGAADRLAARYAGARAFLTLDAVPDALLAGAAATVATPGSSHAALAEALLRRGASVLIEKPAAITAPEFARLRAAQAARQLPVTVFQNYRLRPAMLACWRFLAGHDVGALVRAEVVFHSGRLAAERARWSREEQRHRVLLFELAVHLVDIAATLAGGFAEGNDGSGGARAEVARTADGNTLSIAFAGRSAAGAELRGVIDTSGTESRKSVTLEFERCTIEVAFFPDGFRVLPVRGTPLDDLEADALRLASYARRIAVDRLGRGALPSRARPHAAIYRRHLARLRGEATGPAFSLDSVADTMTALFQLGALVYGDPGADGASE